MKILSVPTFLEVNRSGAYFLLLVIYPHIWIFFVLVSFFFGFWLECGSIFLCVEYSARFRGTTKYDQILLKYSILCVLKHFNIVRKCGRIIDYQRGVIICGVLVTFWILTGGCHLCTVLFVGHAPEVDTTIGDPTTHCIVPYHGYLQKVGRTIACVCAFFDARPFVFIWKGCVCPSALIRAFFKADPPGGLTQPLAGSQPRTHPPRQVPQKIFPGFLSTEKGKIYSWKTFRNFFLWFTGAH